MDDLVKQIKDSGATVKINKAGDPIIMKDGKKIMIHKNDTGGDKVHWHFQRQSRKW